MLGVNIPWGNMTAGDESSIGLYSAAQFDMSGLDDPAVGGIFRGDNLKTDAPEVGVYGWVPAGNSFFSAGVVGVTHGTDTNNYGVYGCNKGGGSAWAGYFEGNVYTTGNVGIGITNPKSKLQVDGGVQVGNDEDTASADKVGTIRYRVSGTTSYAEMCMQTGASAFAWIVITSQSW